VTPAHPRHVPVDDGAELVFRLWLEQARLVLTVRNEAVCEHPLIAERILVAACDTKQVDEGIEIPQPVLNRRCREHEHEAKSSVAQRLLETQSCSWRVGCSVEIAKFV